MITNRHSSPTTPRSFPPSRSSSSSVHIQSLQILYIRVTPKPTRLENENQESRFTTHIQRQSRLKVDHQRDQQQGQTTRQYISSLLDDISRSQKIRAKTNAHCSTKRSHLLRPRNWCHKKV